MKQIYNEGRVVGLSSYELYVRQQLSEDPSSKLPTEREWLSTMFGEGNSMILKIPADSVGVLDFELPEGSQLAACAQITATVFTGYANFDKNTNWADKVLDYGPLIRNDYTSSPTTPGESEDVPYDVPEELDEHIKQSCVDYLKIIDGIVFQPGIWSGYHQDGIEKEFTPDISKKPVVRILIDKALKEDLCIMLTGFLFKSVMAGTVGFDACMDTVNPENGDFLGPMSYPWAVRIHFNVTNDVQYISSYACYEREFPDEDEEYEWGELPQLLSAESDAGMDEFGTNGQKVFGKPIIDFVTSKPEDYYDQHYPDAAIPLHVTDLNVPFDTASVLALYQKDERFNAGLYGQQVTSEGVQNMYPIDTAAPGQMRIYTEESDAQDYPTTYVGTYGIYKDSNNRLFLYDAEGNKIHLSSDVDVQVSASKYKATVTSGDETIKTVSLTNAVNGTDFNTSGARDTGTDCSVALQSIDFLDWTTLLESLGKEKAIEVVGKLLKMYRDNIQFITDSTGNAINTGSKNNYIEFSTSLNGSGVSSGKRLYISSTAPTGNIPDGSIGIGW